MDRTVDELGQDFLRAAVTGDVTAIGTVLSDLDRLVAARPDPRTSLVHEWVWLLVRYRSGDLTAGGPLSDVATRFGSLEAYGDHLVIELGLMCTLTAARPLEAATIFTPYATSLEVDGETRARLIGYLGLANAWSGNIVRGQAQMAEACTLARSVDAWEVLAQVTAWLVRCEALRGDLDASVRHLAEARVLAARSGSQWIATFATEGAAALCLSRGDLDGWVGMLELMVTTGTGSDSSTAHDYRWELATHRALHGDRAGAVALLDLAAPTSPTWPGASLLPTWSDWIRDIDSIAAMAACERAIEQLNLSVERLNRARMAWLLGAHHARHRRRTSAVRLLESACQDYAANGAGGMLRLVVDDLNALLEPDDHRTVSGLLLPLPGEAQLTPAQLRVAIEVANGRSTPEVAALLHVSAKTVEFHLTHIYRKVGVRNRAELAARHGRIG